MTGKDDARLYGRHPEFARMSLKPGIGADMMHDVASTLMDFNLENSQGDVPSTLRHGTREMPLGRYLRGKLRTYTGKDAKAPQSTLDEMAEEMLPLRIRAKTDATAPSLKHQILKENAQKIANLEAKRQIFERKKKL